MSPWRIALAERFWQARHPPRYAAFNSPSSPNLPHSSLQAYQGDTVTLLIPKYEDWARLPVRDENGRIFTYVQKDTAFAILDPSGAREADKRSRAHQSGIVALDRSAPDLDRLTERGRLARTLPKPPALPAPNAFLTGSTEAGEIAVNAGLSPDAETDRARRQETARERAEADALARQAKRRASLAKMRANRTASSGEAS